MPEVTDPALLKLLNAAAPSGGPVYGAPPKPEAPAKPPTAFEVEDHNIKVKQAARADAEWNATHNPDGSKKTTDQLPQAYSQSAMDAFDRAMKSIDTLKEHPGLSAAVGSGFDWHAIGSYNPLTGNVLAGTDAAGFTARLNALKAQVFLPMVQSMKGMGALSNAEGEKLTASIGALDTSMPEADFLKSMDEVKHDLRMYRDRAATRAGHGVTEPTVTSGRTGKKYTFTVPPNADEETIMKAAKAAILANEPATTEDPVMAAPSKGGWGKAKVVE